MSSTFDIYDPPPAPTLEYAPTKREPLIFTRGDLLCLLSLCVSLLVAAAVAWNTEPSLAVITAIAGMLVIFESWLTALGFLHRCRPLSLKARWTIFLAALIPWLIGLASAASVILGLFWMFDLFG
jgi:hypothetical protein